MALCIHNCGLPGLYGGLRWDDPLSWLGLSVTRTVVAPDRCSVAACTVLAALCNGLLESPWSTATSGPLKLACLAAMLQAQPHGHALKLSCCGVM